MQQCGGLLQKVWVCLMAERDRGRSRGRGRQQAVVAYPGSRAHDHLCDLDEVVEIEVNGHCAKRSSNSASCRATSAASSRTFERCLRTATYCSTATRMVAFIERC